jgi:hypothetical protein
MSITDSNIVIRFLTENKKVIPLLHKIGDLWVTNVKLPDIVVSNGDQYAVKLGEMDILGKSDGNEVVRFKLQEKEVDRLIKEANPRINAMLSNGKEWDANVLKVRFGRITVPEGGFAEKGVLDPSDSTIIPLSQMLFFHYIGQNRVEEIHLRLKVKSEHEGNIVEFTMHLMPYKARNSYVFPLKGSMTIANLPMSLSTHRSVLSQEFAFDVAGVTQTQSGEFVTSSKPKPSRLSDYLIYHREVMAIGDGMIVEMGDRFPESRMNNPQTYSEMFFSELCKELLPRIGFLNTVAGNYVVVDHGNDEFSFYGHLSEGCILVSVGQKVKRGDVIAKVGNTGHSVEPHLHFQLMDSPSFLEANGLPVTFENVAATETHEDVVEANSLIYPDFLYIPVSEQNENSNG